MSGAGSSAGPSTGNAGGPVIKGTYPYHYFHFRTRIGQDGEHGVHTSEKGQRIQMKIDRSAALGNWWHSFMDEMFTEAAQRGAAYRGSNQDWMERHSPRAAFRRPVDGTTMESLLLFASGDANAKPDLGSQTQRPAYRGGVGLPILLTQSNDPENPAQGTDLNQNELKTRTERAGIYHEMAMQSFRTKMRRDPDDPYRELEAHTQKMADATKELVDAASAQAGGSAPARGRDWDGDVDMTRGADSASGTADLARYVAFLERQKDAIVSEKIGHADRSTRPVGSAAFLPWLMLHPQQRSPTFKWFLRAVGGALGTNAIVTHSASDVSAHHVVDLREVVPRRGAPTLSAAAPPAVIDGKAPAAPAAAAGSKKKQKKIKKEFNAATWDAPYMRATWRVAALLYDLGLRMRWMQKYKDPSTTEEANKFPARCYPFFEGKDEEGKVKEPPPYVAKGPNINPSDGAQPLLVRFLSGVALTSTEFPEERIRANEAHAAKGGPTCVTMMAMSDVVGAAVGYHYVKSQKSAHKAGWQAVSFSQKGLSENCSNIAYALRTECARLLDVLSLEHASDADMLDNERRAQHIRDIMTLSKAMGNDHPSVEDLDEEPYDYSWLGTVTAGNLSTKRGMLRVWAVRRLKAFIERGIAHAMDATTILTTEPVVHYSAMAGLQAKDELQQDQRAAFAVCGLANTSVAEFPDQVNTADVKSQSLTMTTRFKKEILVGKSMVERAKHYANVVGELELTKQVDKAMRSEFAVMKEICELLCNRNGITSNGQTESPPWTTVHMNEAAEEAAAAGKDLMPQSVFDKEEEAYLRTMRQMTDADLLALNRFVDFNSSATALTETTKVHARRLLRRFFGTEGPNGPRRWPWMLNKALGAPSHDLLVRYDDGSVLHQTGPAQFVDPTQWVYPDGQTQAERTKFIKNNRLRGIKLCNEWGALNTYRPVIGVLDSNSRWTLPGADGNLMEWKWDPSKPDTDSHDQPGIRILSAIAYRNKAIHKARLAWAEYTVQQYTNGASIDQQGLLTAFPPPTFNGEQLYVKGYDYVGNLPAQAMQAAVAEATAANSVTFQDAEVSAVAKEAQAALAIKGMYPRLAFAFKAQPAPLGYGHVREYVRLKKENQKPTTSDADKGNNNAAIRTQERMLRVNSFAYLVFAKQRECEMQQVYTSHNIALTKQTYEFDRDGWIQKVSAYGPDTPDIENVRRPLMIRQRYTEYLHRERSATVELTALKDEYTTDRQLKPATVDAKDTAFMMLDVPFGLLRELGVKYIREDNAPNGTNPAVYSDSVILNYGKLAMLRKVAPTEALSSCNTAAWKGTETSDIGYNNELTLALIRKPVLLKDPNEALPSGVAKLPDYDDRYVFSPSRYQHPAMLCLPELWTVNPGGRHLRNPKQKLHYDRCYLRKAYYDFMHDLKHILALFQEDDQTAHATSAYSGSGYMATNALLRLAQDNSSSYSALGKHWASHRIQKLFKASDDAEKHYVEPYSDDENAQSCRVYELAYHLYENPVGIGRENLGDAAQNPYATTLPQWMANHMQLANQLAGVWVGVDDPNGSPTNIVKDPTGLAIEKMNEWALPPGQAYLDRLKDAWTNDAIALQAARVPMYTDQNSSSNDLPALFIPHNLHKLFYSAPRLQREIQVCRGEKFDFLCDSPNSNANATNAPFQAGQIKVGQRFITQSVISTSMHDPYQYMFSSSGDYHEPGYAPGSANSGFWYPKGYAAKNKTAGCCLHLMTIAKGTPILPLYLCEEWDDVSQMVDADQIGGSEVTGEEELMLPPNCEFEFLGMVRVPRFHEGDKFANDAKKEAAMKETVSAFCWFVRWRGAPRGGFLPGQPGGIVQAPPNLASAQVSGEVAMSKADAAPEKDAGYYTDDEDLDWGVGEAPDAQRAHLHPSLLRLQTPRVNMAGLDAASTNNGGPSLFSTVPWPWKPDLPL